MHSRASATNASRCSRLSMLAASSATYSSTSAGLVFVAGREPPPRGVLGQARRRPHLDHEKLVDGGADAQQDGQRAVSVRHLPSLFAAHVLRARNLTRRNANPAQNTA